MARGAPSPGAFALQVQRRFPEQGAPEVFSKIRGWLAAEGATITDEVPGQRLVAKHGRRLQAKGWAKDARKTLSFVISADGAGCQVDAIVNPSVLSGGDLVAMGEAAHANWTELLEELWGQMGAKGHRRFYAAVAPQDWEEVLAKAEKRMRRGLLVTVVTLVALFGTIALSVSSGVLLTDFQARVGLAGPSLVLTWGVSDLLYGWTRQREARRERARK